MGITVKVQIDSSDKIIQRHGLEDEGPAVEFLAQEVERLSKPYVPDSQEHHLQNSGRANAEKKGTILYPGPYAHYQYTGKLMLAKSGSSWAKLGEKKHYTGQSLNYHGGGKSGSEWDKRMWNDRGKEICKDLERYIKNGCK